MNVVPAQVAGVASIAVVSPPQRDFGGWPHPTILAACALLGIDEVYAVGGAQAVAMLAYGVDLPDGGRCAPVDLVTGPGNIYVTAAKRALQGVIGIDSEAGPTEILVLADDTGDAAHIASDLISQAEHDVLAAAVLVTTSPELADAVESEVVRQVGTTKHAQRITEAIRRLHQEFAQPLRMEEMASELGMSVSSFHHHFKEVTAMSPLQFQKHLRLQEARRLMLGEHLDATSAGYRVGYDDVSHFNREYKRFFGAPPRRDVVEMRRVARDTAGA